MTEKSVRSDRITVSFIPDKASAETAVETIRNFMLRSRRLDPTKVDVRCEALKAALAGFIASGNWLSDWQGTALSMLSSHYRSEASRSNSDVKPFVYLEECDAEKGRFVFLAVHAMGETPTKDVFFDRTIAGAMRAVEMAFYQYAYEQGFSLSRLDDIGAGVRNRIVVSAMRAESRGIQSVFRNGIAVDCRTDYEDADVLLDAALCADEAALMFGQNRRYGEGTLRSNPLTGGRFLSDGVRRALGLSRDRKGAEDGLHRLLTISRKGEERRIDEFLILPSAEVYRLAEITEGTAHPLVHMLRRIGNLPASAVRDHIDAVLALRTQPAVATLF